MASTWVRDNAFTLTYKVGGADTDASGTIYVFKVTIDEPATEFVAVDEMIAPGSRMRNDE